MRIHQSERAHALHLYLAEVWAAAADAMVLSDADGCVLAANPAYYEHYGYTPEQVVGHRFAITAASENCARAEVNDWALFRTGVNLPAYEATIRHADGAIRSVEVCGSFITIDTQPVMLSVIRDITERKHQEQECNALLLRERAARVEAENAIRMRDQLLTVAAHELKNPLTTLRGYAQIVRRHITRGQPLNERDERALTIVDSQAKRLQRLIDSLLDLRRIRANDFVIERKPIDFSTMIQTLVSEYQPTLEHHTLMLESDAEALIVAGDEQRLEQVVQNLLHNAVKYSPAGGMVTVRLQRQGDQALLSVIDQGLGIPADAVAHLFEQFYRAPNVTAHRIQGMGIGLYVVKKIIDLHGGAITVASQEGEGSTFTVLFPLYSAEPVRATTE